MMLELTRTIQPLWPSVREMRGEVGERLAALSKELRNATTMTASELLENAIKYGESVPGAECIAFTLQADDAQIKIRVVNGSTNGSAVTLLRERVREIAAAEDKSALYFGRLQALLACPEESGQLGLYRIAFEGQYELSCRYGDNIVTVIATRKIS